jgi:hypothetical protein
MILWDRELLKLIALIVLGAALVLLHLALCLRALRAPGVPTWLRWLAWLPPLTPFAGFRSRAYGLAVLWFIIAGTYLVLRNVG